MCSECRHDPCVSGCPNYNPITYGVCTRCGDSFLEGESIYDVENGSLCEDCFKDFKYERLRIAGEETE